MIAVENTVDLVLHVLKARPSLLITDIDGTISRIAPHPEGAYVSDVAREGLRRIARHVDVLAIVTARESDVARRMVGLDDVLYVGNYALDDETMATLSGFDIPATLEAIRLQLEEHPCVEIETKGVSFALHYRNCPEPDVRQHLLTHVLPIAQSLGARVVEGKQVLELVPAALPDKSVAVGHLLRQHGSNGVVFIGDDLSDAAVFRALARRRSEEGKPSLTIAVEDDETEAVVLEAADTHVAGVDGVEALLAEIAGRLEEASA